MRSCDVRLLSNHSRLSTRKTQKRARSRYNAVASYGFNENHIVPRYFQTYVDVICESNENSGRCLETMIIPDPQTQIDILQKFDLFVNTYRVVDASPFLQSSLLKLLVIEDDNTIEQLVDLLNNYTIITHMIQETIKNI